MEHNAATLPSGFENTAASLRRLVGEVEEHYHEDVEGLEKRLIALEENMIAAAWEQESDDERLESRRELDRQLRPHRGKITTKQLQMLEKHYLEQHLLEKFKLPRLSLFYMATAQEAL